MSSRLQQSSSSPSRDGSEQGQPGPRYKFTYHMRLCLPNTQAGWRQASVTNEYDEETRKHIAMTKEDLRKLQVAENSVMRMMTGLDYKSSTMELLQKSNLLSVNQLIAYHTLVQVYNIQSKQLPSFHFRRLFGRLDGQVSTRSVRNQECRIKFSSSQARGSFFYQGGLLWNRIPQQMKNIPNLPIFKKQAQRWTLNNILAKP